MLDVLIIVGHSDGLKLTPVAQEGPNTLTAMLTQMLDIAG